MIQRSPVAADPLLPVEAAQSSGTVLGAEGQPFALPRSPEPLAPQPAQSAAARPEIAAVQPELGAERSAPAPDHVASPRPQVAALAFPAKPAADAEPSPRPNFASTTEASAGTGDQPQAIQTLRAAEATPLAPRPEVVAPPPAPMSPRSKTAGSRSNGDAAQRMPPTPPAAVAVPAAVIQRSAIAQSHALPAESGDSSGPVPGTTIQPPAVVRPPESIAPLPIQAAAVRPEIPAGRTMQAAPITLSAVGRYAPSPAPRAPAANAEPPTEQSSTVAHATFAPATAAPATFSGHGHALSAEAAKSLGSAKAPAGQSPPLARPAESMAPLAAWGRGRTTADRLEQAPGQPAPAARVKPSAAVPNAPASMLSPLKAPELARAASNGLEASRSRPAGEQAVVRPVLPAGSDAPASQGSAGRNPSQSEAAPLPTIRVTIGRIEVRSSAPALPAAASSPGQPRPALSLDDYLKPPAKVRP